MSNSAVTVKVDLLSNLSEVFDGTAYSSLTVVLLSPSDPATTTDVKPMYWATTYGDSGPECSRASDGDGDTWANVTWTNASPSAKQTWQSWLVIPEQIAPSLPPLSSKDSAANWFAFGPLVTIGQEQVNLTFDSPHGLVRCRSTAGFGHAHPAYVPVSPAAATARGCQSAA